MKAVNQVLRSREIIGDILLVLAILLLADVIAVMLHKIHSVVLKADYQVVFRYEFILCAVFLLFALDVRFGLFTWPKCSASRIAGRVLRMIVVCLTLLTVFFCGKVICGSVINTAGRADKAIVLGLALENGKPTDDLLARLDTTRTYLEKYPEAQLILTGGNPDGSCRTEAAVMRDILTGLGVPQEKMNLEGKAGSTRENFKNTAKMVDPARSIVLISSNYHMDRAVQAAKDAGFTDILRLPAPSSFLSYGADVLSEAVLELNELTFRH